MFCAVGHLSRLVAADHCRRELNLWVCDAAGPHWNVAFIWPSSSSLLLMANKMPLLCQMFQRIWPKPPGLGGQWMPRWGARTYLIISESPAISHMMRVLLKSVFFPFGSGEKPELRHQHGNECDAGIACGNNRQQREDNNYSGTKNHHRCLHYLPFHRHLHYREGKPNILHHTAANQHSHRGLVTHFSISDSACSINIQTHSIQIV